MSKQGSFKIGIKSFDIDYCLLIGKTEFCKLNKDVVRDPSDVYKSMKEIRETEKKAKSEQK